jgi:hypothetical protein
LDPLSDFPTYTLHCVLFEMLACTSETTQPHTPEDQSEVLLCIGLGNLIHFNTHLED